MRALAAVVILGVVSALPPAFAETWRTKVTLMEAASPSNCVEADVSKLFYDVTVTGNELSLKTGIHQFAGADVHLVLRVSRGAVRLPRRDLVRLATGDSKRLHQSLQPSGGPMEPLARIDLFDLDDATFASTDCVDGVYTKPAVVDEPRHDQLGH